MSNYDERYRNRRQTAISNEPHVRERVWPYRFDDEEHAIVPKNPTDKQSRFLSINNFLNVINESGDILSKALKAVAYSRIKEQIVGQLPTGKEYILMVYNPGGWGGRELIVIYAADLPRSPSFLVEGQAPAFAKEGIWGQNTGKRVTSEVNVDSRSRGRMSVPVLDDPSIQPWRVIDLPNAGRRGGGGVGREPKGVPRPTPVPPDSKFDRNHPGYRDGGRMA